MAEDRIYVYPQNWKLLGASLIMIGVAWLVWDMTQVPEGTYSVRFGNYITIRITGYICLLPTLFMLYVSLVQVLQTVILRRPLAKIYDDRLEYLVPIKFRYEVVPYIDVRSFVQTKVAGVSIIVIQYVKKKSVETSIRGFVRPDIDEVCEFLNDKLTEYRKQPVLSEYLDFDSVARNLVLMGVDKTRFDFGAVIRPDCMVLKRTKKGYCMFYIDDCGCRLRRGYFKTENDACHALLTHFLREEALQKSAAAKQ